MDHPSRHCFKQYRIVIRVAPCEMGDSSFGIKEALARAHKISIYPLLNERVSIPLIGPSKSWAIKTQIHHIAFIKALFEKKGPINAHWSTPKFIFINKWFIKVPSYHPRLMMHIRNIRQIIPENTSFCTSRTGINCSK